jgi:hypothetical protein
MGWGRILIGLIRLAKITNGAGIAEPMLTNVNVRGVEMAHNNEICDLMAKNGRMRKALVGP